MEEQRKRPRIFPIEEIETEKIIEEPKVKKAIISTKNLGKKEDVTTYFKLLISQDDINRFKILALKKGLTRSELFTHLLDTIENS